MTDRQLLNFYLPAWHRALGALWIKAGRNLIPAAGRPESERLEQVEAYASRFQRVRSAKFMSKEDLRHAANYVACGKSSSKEFTNADVQLAVAFLDLLVDPLNLSASVRVDHPELAERAGYEAHLRGFPEAYVTSISRNRFNQANWLDLSLEQLRQLSMTLRHRKPTALFSRTLPKSKSLGRQTEHAPT